MENFLFLICFARVNISNLLSNPVEIIVGFLNDKTLSISSK